MKKPPKPGFDAYPAAGTGAMQLRDALTARFDGAAFLTFYLNDEVVHTHKVTREDFAFTHKYARYLGDWKFRKTDLADRVELLDTAGNVIEDRRWAKPIRDALIEFNL